MVAATGEGNTAGLGQLFGASAFNGPPEYMNAFKQFKNFSMSALAAGKVLGNVLAFTESQIQAGRQKGGNAIHSRTMLRCSF